ncbi:MAG: hypothetical protein ABI338_08815 [Gemmatimonadaceae bacterium]
MPVTRNRPPGAESKISILTVIYRIDVGILIQVVVESFVVVLIVVLIVVVKVIVIFFIVVIFVDIQIIIIIVVIIIIIIDVVNVAVIIQVVVFVVFVVGVEVARSAFVLRVFFERLRQDIVHDGTGARANRRQHVEILQQHVFRLHLNYTGFTGS